MNLTDVDDRTIAAAVGKGVSLREHVDPFARAFEEDRDWLRILPPHAQPRATEYIGPMIELIAGPAGARGRVQGRGRLGLLRHRPVPRLRPALPARPAGAARRGERAGERRRVRQGGRARLRALEGGQAGGRGGRRGLGCAVRPGAPRLAHRVLGDGAGADPAQVERGRARHPRRGGGSDLPAPRGRDRPELRLHRAKEEFARVWVHGEFLDLAGTKMSKRYGNILTARDLREQGADPGAVRHLLFNTHYRQKLDWSDAALARRREGSARLGAFRDRLALAAGREDDSEAAAAAERFRAAFAAALDDDLNAPEALGALHVLVREGNRLLDEGRRLGPAFQAAWALADDVLAVAPSARARTVTADALPWPRRTAFRFGHRRFRRPTRPTPRHGRCAGRRSAPRRSGPGTSPRRTGSGTASRRPDGRSGTAGTARSRWSGERVVAGVLRREARRLPELPGMVPQHHPAH